MSTNSPVIIAGTPERIDSPAKFSVYSNSAEVLLGLWDVRINFMENIPPQGSKPVVTVHGSVVMSPAHAKAFLDGLKKAIELYEEKFGEIEVQKLLDAQKAMSPGVTSPTQ